MPTAKQSWLKKYQTYYAQTEYNKEHYGKRIKQLQAMLEDEKEAEKDSTKDPGTQLATKDAPGDGQIVVAQKGAGREVK